MKGIDGKLYPVSIGDTLDATKPASEQIFDLSFPASWFNGSVALAAEDISTNAFFIDFYYSSTNRYTMRTFNVFGSADFNRQVYFVGYITGGGFKLDNSTTTSWYTTIIPTSEDGKVYLPVGVLGNTDATFSLVRGGQAMQFKNGAFQPYSSSFSPIWRDITNGATTGGQESFLKLQIDANKLLVLRIKTNATGQISISAKYAGNTDWANMIWIGNIHAITAGLMQEITTSYQDLIADVPSSSVNFEGTHLSITASAGDAAIAAIIYFYMAGLNIFAKVEYINIQTDTEV
jgi:hypothetical protein